MLRVGQGFDVHRLVEGRKLILGGVRIPFHFGLKGHSDADVLIHAIIDAVLGAANEGDIGSWFPPADDTFKGADSLALLATVLQSSSMSPWKVVNIDATIIAEAPRINPFIPAMRDKIGVVTKLDPTCISIKATTTEGLGLTGRGEGIAAMAVALLDRR